MLNVHDRQALSNSAAAEYFHFFSEVSALEARESCMRLGRFL
jgi:hypothetical protein